MNEQDKAAFEKWSGKYFEIEGEMVLEISPHFNECWQAALEYKRDKTQKLVEALEIKLAAIRYHNTEPENCIAINKILNSAKEAFKEYRGEGI